MVTMPTMAGDRPIDVRRIDTIPEDGVVTHFDELTEDVQSWLVAATNGGASAEEAAAATESFDDGAFVVYTGYYQVRTT